MTRIFLDSSVLFSACYSSGGHSRDLILMALRGEVQLVCSNYVIEETRRNLEKSAPEQILFLDFVLDSLEIEIVRPTKRQVLAAAEHVVLKDAPIVAGAKRAGVDYLVTLDKKHLLSNMKIPQYANVEVQTPRNTVIALKAN